jgi:hypothetical protein
VALREKTTKLNSHKFQIDTTIKKTNNLCTLFPAKNQQTAEAFSKY